jgi:hypothetical protein
MPAYSISQKVAAEGDQQRPYWMNPKRLHDICTECRVFGDDSMQCMKYLRHHNQKVQLCAPSWDYIQRVKQAPSKEEKEKIIDDIMSALQNSDRLDDLEENGGVRSSDILYRPGESAYSEKGPSGVSSGTRSVPCGGVRVGKTAGACALQHSHCLPVPTGHPRVSP